MEKPRPPLRRVPRGQWVTGSPSSQAPPCPWQKAPRGSPPLHCPKPHGSRGWAYHGWKGGFSHRGGAHFLGPPPGPQALPLSPQRVWGGGLVGRGQGMLEPRGTPKDWLGRDQVL